MSAVAIVTGVTEGLQLLSTLLSSASQVSTAIQTAQSTGQPVNLAPIQAQVVAAENAFLAAIAADPNKS
jgi:uncharacterized membrane protein